MKTGCAVLAGGCFLMSGAASSPLERKLQLAASAQYSTVLPIRTASAMIGQRDRSEYQRSRA